MSRKDVLYTPYNGAVLLENPLLNKGLAFIKEERDNFNLHGLLPHNVETIEEQTERAWVQFCHFKSDISRHVYLRNIQDTNETLFYNLLRSHLKETLPIIYTPTVGEACEHFSTIYRRARGLFISWPNRHRIDEMLQSFSRNDIRVIAAGNGCTDDLQLEHLPANTDIRVGDVLVTSGLGGRFPEGYPVGVVSSVKLDTQRAYTVIQARPTAGLQRLRYLLLLWGADRNGANPMTPEEVHRVANERLMQMMPQVLPAPDAMGPQMPAPATGITPPSQPLPAGGQ